MIRRLLWGCMTVPRHLATMLTEAPAYSSRGVGLIHDHLVSSTSRMRKNLWSGGMLLLLLWCGQEMGSWDCRVLGSCMERHGRRLQWLCKGRARHVLVADDSLESALLGVHQLHKGIPACTCVQ